MIHSTDERVFNKRKGPGVYHKLRVIAQDTNKEDVFGVTIPRHIALQFYNCYFKITTENDCIVLQSGCKLNLKEEAYGKNILAQ